jgi:hypothetical protein
MRDAFAALTGRVTTGRSFGLGMGTLSVHSSAHNDILPRWVLALASMTARCHYTKEHRTITADLEPRVDWLSRTMCSFHQSQGLRLFPASAFR